MGVEMGFIEEGYVRSAAENGMIREYKRSRLI